MNGSRLTCVSFQNHRSIEKPAPKKGESSKIPSSNIGLTNSLPADIQRAWVQVTAAEFPVRLKVKIIRLSQREQELHLFRSINADGFVRLRISQHVSNITVSDFRALMKSRQAHLCLDLRSRFNAIPPLRRRTG